MLGALSELSVLSTQGIDLRLQTIDVSLIEGLNRSEALTTNIEGQTCDSRQTECVGEVRSVRLTDVEAVVRSFTLDEDVDAGSDVEGQLETTVSRSSVRVGQTCYRVVELVLIAYPYVRNDVEYAVGL